MKYFLDTEFLEGTQKTWFGQSKPTIDLISIGIVAEDGREYYAISNEFNLKEAWNRCDIKRTKTGNNPYRSYWLRDNILKSIHYELASKEVSTPSYDTWLEVITLRENGVYGDRHYKTLKKLINKYGKSNKQIAEEVYKFIYPRYEYEKDKVYIGNVNRFDNKFVQNYWVEDIYLNPEFYGYYADYDWVVFCWLFGKMIDLPQGFPMYCIDLKQELERLTQEVIRDCGNNDNSYKLQEHPNYPKQTNEHNSLSDAKWVYELYKFL